MSNLNLYKVDLDTPQPNGRRGESPRSAFTKHNDLIDALLGGMVDVISSTAPATAPYVTWVDTSVNPPLIRRRNAANTQWVTIGPALAPFGSAAYRDAIGSAPLYGRDSVVGTVGQSGGIPTGAIIQRGSNANGEFVMFADGSLLCKLPYKDPGPSEGNPVGGVYRSGRINFAPPVEIVGEYTFIPVQKYRDAAYQVWTANLGNGAGVPGACNLSGVQNALNGDSRPHIGGWLMGRWF